MVLRMENFESTNNLISNASHSMSFAPRSFYATKDILAVSDKVVKYAEIINIVILSCLIGLVGVVTNVINLIVFVRLGFKETINISLFALTISDLASSTLLVWVTVCVNPLLWYADTHILFFDFEFHFATWPRVMLITTNAFLTVFITLERYLCIVFPLKVKEIMTRKRVTITIIAIYVINIAVKVQNYFVFRLDWKWIPPKNRSMFGVIYLPNYRPIELASQQIQNTFMLTSFMIVSVFTALFVWKLKQRGIWRRAVSGAKEEPTSVRDQRIVMMVTCVAIIFIVCNFPHIVQLFFMLSSPQIDIGMKYENLYRLLVSVQILAGAINGSVNIFIYHKMMSKYRAVLRSLFGKQVAA